MIYRGENKPTMSRKVIRDQIVPLKQAGLSDKEVMTQLNVSRKTVLNAMKCFAETDNTSSLPILGRKWSARTARSVKIAKKRLQRNPRRSVQKSGKGAEDVGKISEKDCQRGVRLKSIQIPTKTPNISSFQEKTD